MNRFLNIGLLGVAAAAVVAGCGGGQAGGESPAPQYAAERVSLEADPRPAAGASAASGDGNGPPPSAGGSAASGDGNGPPPSAGGSAASGDAHSSPRAAPAK